MTQRTRRTSKARTKKRVRENAIESMRNDGDEEGKWENRS